MTSEERVYVIGTPGSNTVKIGRTIDLVKRLADIQRMSPVPLEVLWSTPGGHELETRLHRHFKPQRSHGEWFTFESDPIMAIRTAAIEVSFQSGRAMEEPPLDQQAVAELLTELRAASEAFQGTRVELDRTVAGARAAGLSLTEISEHSPYSREWVRRISMKGISSSDA